MLTIPAPLPSASLGSDGLPPALPDILRAVANLLLPQYGPGGDELVGFALNYFDRDDLLASKQRKQAVKNIDSLLTRFPQTLPAGVFTFYRHVFETGEAGRYALGHSTEDPANRYYLTAQRCGPWLIVRFDDTLAPHPIALPQDLDLQASNPHLQLVTEAVPVLVRYLARNQDDQFAGWAYEAWFGYPPPAPPHRPVQEMMGKLAYQQVSGYIAQALAGERVDVEAQMPDREGNIKHLRTSYVPDMQKGKVVGFYALVTDNSEQVRARQRAEQDQQQVRALNQQLAALNDKLYAANTALATANEELGVANDELGDTNQELTRTNVDLDTFVYTAAHDLKGPITNLDGLLHALREELPAANQVGQVGHILGLMNSSLDRFHNTLVHLSAIGQLQQQRGQLVPPVRLAAVIRDVRLDLAPQIRAAHARLTIDLQGFPTFPFSEKNLRSVVYNLLSNALKYRHPDRAPHVRLHCRLEAPYWVVAVQDNGLGLDLALERPLFGLFERFHTHVEGSGVGLYMVKKMMENAGGKITVQSQVGVGSTFTVYFKY